MDKLAMTEAIMAAKAQKALTWETIAETVGLDTVFVTSACLGQNSMPPEYGDKLTAALDLPPEVVSALAKCPTKGTDQKVPTDPLIYRFYEIMQVYGGTVKEVIHEKFGDGIMSAIDFTLNIDRQEDPKGDRVVVTMNGKFLPYKMW